MTAMVSVVWADAHPAHGSFSCFFSAAVDAVVMTADVVHH